MNILFNFKNSCIFVIFILWERFQNGQSSIHSRTWEKIILYPLHIACIEYGLCIHEAIHHSNTNHQSLVEIHLVWISTKIKKLGQLVWKTSCVSWPFFRSKCSSKKIETVKRMAAVNWCTWFFIFGHCSFNVCVCLHTSHPNPFLWIFIILFGWSVWWCCARRLPSKLHSAICSIRCCVYWAVSCCRSATIANRCAWCARHYCTVTIIGAIIRIGYIVGIVAAGVVCGVCFIHIRIIYIG